MSKKVTKGSPVVVEHALNATKAESVACCDQCATDKKFWSDFRFATVGITIALFFVGMLVFSGYCSRDEEVRNLKLEVEVYKSSEQGNILLYGEQRQAAMREYSQKMYYAQQLEQCQKGNSK